MLAALTGLPILFPWFSNSVSVTWTKSELNGLYTRVHFFIRKQGTEDEDNAEPSQRNNPDLVVEIPLSSLGKTSYYKYCLPSNSKLTASSTQAAVASDSPENQKCELKYLGSSDTKYAEISYLLETATKFLEAQHAINMLGFYGEALKVKDELKGATGGGSENELFKECSFANQDTKQFSKDLFFKPKVSNKDCYVSPSKANIHIVTEENGDGVAKDKLAKVMWGEITYGIFDYWYSLKTQPSNLTNGAELHIKWPWKFKLEGDGSDKCNWDVFKKLARTGELRLETLVQCV